MVEADRHRVQRVAGQAELRLELGQREGRRRRRPGALAVDDRQEAGLVEPVQLVAQQRVTDLRHVHADLVLAAGLRLDLDQRDRRAAELAVGQRRHPGRRMHAAVIERTWANFDVDLRILGWPEGSGVLASMWDTYDDKANFFWVNFGLLMFATLLMFTLVKKLNKVMKEKGIN